MEATSRTLFALVFAKVAVGFLHDDGIISLLRQGILSSFSGRGCCCGARQVSQLSGCNGVDLRCCLREEGGRERERRVRSPSFSTEVV